MQNIGLFIQICNTYLIFYVENRKIYKRSFFSFLILGVFETI